MEAEQNQEGGIELTDRPSISIKYKEVDGLQTLYVSNFLTTTTTDNLINIVGYTERRAFPTDTTVRFKKTENDSIKGIEDDVNSVGWIREIQSSLIIDVAAAQALINVLSASLDEIETDSDDDDDDDSQ